MPIAEPASAAASRRAADDWRGAEDLRQHFDLRQPHAQIAQKQRRPAAASQDDLRACKMAALGEQARDSTALHVDDTRSAARENLYARPLPRFRQSDSSQPGLPHA